MRHEDEKDARAFRDGANAIETLLDADLPMQIQHAPNRRGGRLCGAESGAIRTGVVTAYGITCAACLAKFNARPVRGRRGR